VCTAVVAQRQSSLNTYKVLLLQRFAQLHGSRNIAPVNVQ
jgi:hypothetical protein